MWPVHTWLPDAHVEAPTGGSVILAAIMLKMGGYGFVRLSLPIVHRMPRSRYFWLMITLSLIAVVYIGLVALVQKDMKKLIAYSSIAHMGFVTLGFFLLWPILANSGTTSGAALGIGGGMVQMVSHGLDVRRDVPSVSGSCTTACTAREIADYGGVANTMPALRCLHGVVRHGQRGPAWHLRLRRRVHGHPRRAFKANFWYAFLAATTLMLGAAYTLWMVKRVVFGDIANDHVAALTDLNRPRVFRARRARRGGAGRRGLAGSRSLR